MNHTMKNIQKYHIASFLDRRSHNWQQRICLITFLTLSLSVVVQGVPMHFFGWIGRSDTTLYAISALTWTWTLGVLVLFLLKRLSLKVAISAFGIMMQLAESARIVYAAVERLEGFEETILFNQVISVALIFYLVMASVRHVPAVIAAISMATICFAYFNTEGGINRQMVVIFIIVEITTCVLGEIIRRGIRGMMQENDDFQSTLDDLLSTFHMSKTELLAYLQMGRGNMSDEDISDFFDHLDERTEANLIRAVEQRMNHRRMQNADISSVMPSLTPTEREVCRLIVGGKTNSEIAAILKKTSNNVSTVRIHIRKKLGLTSQDDLRETLLNLMEK